MRTVLDDDRKRKIEDFLGEWMVEASVPGASVAILEDNELVYSAGFGSRNLATNAPATPKTLYGVASVTKSFTALGILVLAERGELSLMDRIGDYLEELTIDDADRPITIRELLTHSSGMPSLGTSTVLLYRLTGLKEHGIPLADKEDFYRHINRAESEIASQEPDRFMYCNAGYNLLGEIISSVAQRPFAAFIEANILSPLQMQRSTFDPGVLEEGDAMTPYTVHDEEPEPTPFPYRSMSEPAGGLIAPVDELVHYLRLQMGTLPEGYEIGISRDRLEEAHTGHVVRDRGHYGYGWNRREFLGRTLVGHGGSLGVSSSYIGFTTDGKFAIAITANTTPSPTPPTVAKGVLAILDGSKPSDVVPYYSRTTRFDELTGEYATYRGIKTATVEKSASVLRLRVDHPLGTDESVLLPVDSESPGQQFNVPTASGTMKRADFEEHGDHIDLYFDRNRFHQQS